MQFYFKMTFINKEYIKGEIFTLVKRNIPNLLLNNTVKSMESMYVKP